MSTPISRIGIESYQGFPYYRLRSLVDQQLSYTLVGANCVFKFKIVAKKQNGGFPRSLLTLECFPNPLVPCGSYASSLSALLSFLFLLSAYLVLCL